MAHGMTHVDWTSALPRVFKWAEDVRVSGATQAIESLESGAHYIVFALKPEGKGAAPSDRQSGKDTKVDAGGRAGLLTDLLPAPVVAKINEVVAALGPTPSFDRPVTLLEGGAVISILGLSRPGKGSSPCQRSRQAGLDVAGHLSKFAQSHANIVCSSAASLDPLDLLDGMGLAFFEAHAFKSKDESAAPPRFPERLTFVGSSVDTKRLDERRTMMRAVGLARLLQEAPANWLDPEQFAAVAREVAAEAKIGCEVLGRSELQKLGMGAFLSVGDGSVREPKLIRLDIPGKRADKTLVLVGKGLTFDSGGISIKPSAGMGEMKYDMSGGAAVLGAAYFLSRHEPECRVICLIGAVENMPSGAATKPGDIVRAMNGKTIEVLNTDAEGRLVLADLLAYAVGACRGDAVVDVATLTGAVLTALGHVGAAIMSNDQGFCDWVRGCAERVGEPLWQLPLWGELEKEVRGEAADLANIAKPNVGAGTIIGGLFLKEFVGKTPWVHLDIAGTAWACRATGFPGNSGTAFSLRTLVELGRSGLPG